MGFAQDAHQCKVNTLLIEGTVLHLSYILSYIEDTVILKIISCLDACTEISIRLATDLVYKTCYYSRDTVPAAFTLICKAHIYINFKS